MLPIQTLTLIAAAILPAPVLVAPAAPSCAIESRPAALQSTDPFDYPPLAEALHLAGVARVRVDLAATGRVISASLVRSAGSQILNKAAIDAAKSMVYTPELRDCRAVAGSYAVEIEFTR